MKPSRFNLRVYGLLLNEQQEVLVADEIQLFTRMTKFPGGGLEFGEGLEAGLKREWKEELGVEVVVGKHLYTNGFFQASSFDPKDQIIASYYQVYAPLPLPVPITQKPFDFEREENGIMAFRWISLDELSPAHLTFPIDQELSRRLKDMELTP